MADENPPAEQQGGTTGPPAMYKILAWFLAPVFVITALPTVILLTVGMVPTIVAYIVDRHPRARRRRPRHQSSRASAGAAADRSISTV